MTTVEFVQFGKRLWIGKLTSPPRKGDQVFIDEKVWQVDNVRWLFFGQTLDVVRVFVSAGERS